MKNNHLFQITLFLSIQIVLSSTVSKSLLQAASSKNVNSELIDKLMTLWYQVETLKECGYNLERLNIDLESLWSTKFKRQFQKLISLTNLINNYISNSTSLDLQFISVLNNFLIDENDPYLIGYGVIYENNCVFISQNSQIDYSCTALNYNPNSNSNSQYIIESDLDQLKNCSQWYSNFKTLYNQNKFFSRESNPQNFLQNLLNYKNFSSKLYCGPFYECKTDKSEWVLLNFLPIFDREKSLKGTVLIKLLISKLDVNQCANGDPIFMNTHKCKPYSECVHVPRSVFRQGNYECKCQRGYMSNSDILHRSFNGTTMEELYWKMKNHQNDSYLKLFNCLPCSDMNCCVYEEKFLDMNLLNGKPRMVGEVETATILNREFYSTQATLFWNCRKYNMPLRYTILVVQIVFAVVTISIAALVFCSRHNKIIKHSMWVLLEIILFGAFLLYSSLIIQHFEPTTNFCLAIPWFREIGFTVIYGILNLRLYKILIEFQSRKAHVVQLKDKDILRILFFIIICVFGYLTAWTLVDLDYASEGYSLVTNTSLKGFIQYPICKIKWWDYFIEIAEFLFICVGFYLLYCTRTAPSEYNERKFISLVIYCEGIISTLLHIIKHSIFSSIHPDTILILYFVRCHATVTVMLLFIFFTKLFILVRPNSDEYCRSSRLSTVDGNDHSYTTDSVRFQIGIFGKPEYDNGDVNFNEMEPEEIKSELKRLYTQLHVFKTKSAKKDNPHLQSKRRGLNKKHRRFSNQFSKATTRENESCHIRTPDESICSNEVTNIPHLIVEAGGDHNHNTHK
ncbi:unnamed protein product [Brachionus calyciflorus]|uniref:G-protein coupled receptors family 3 profile domain-containing protein n=1 Tax=Brachionus calyciflorus TaxID=104777 RepID=A0A813RLZ5_9BILA|nr:unnamed protein product [Brachionus calyciflorus]